MTDQGSRLRALDTALLGVVVVLFLFGPFEVAGLPLLPFAAFALSGTNAALATHRPDPRYWWRHVGFAGVWGLFGLVVLLNLDRRLYAVAAVYGLACFAMSIRAARSGENGAA
ncbi:hypothetical protein [Haloarcula salina]|uniref:Uncharacterized protein n=1 Tax=Haloarcula salina TaxID=1429914 RepID=A0AA41KE66_9EURY|nr:hypothetical protein [Haloarcula salina]MBV0900567.1 hypothetical protein [Haloarcula salina]